MIQPSVIGKVFNNMINGTDNTKLQPDKEIFCLWKALLRSRNMHMDLV
jgi:hypothetical protein